MSASARRDFCIRWSLELEQQKGVSDDLLDYNRRSKGTSRAQHRDYITAHCAPGSEPRHFRPSGTRWATPWEARTDVDAWTNVASTLRAQLAPLASTLGQAKAARA